MNSRDRVLLTIDHKEPDMVPMTDFIYMQRSLEGILGKKGVTTATVDSYVKVHRALDLDLITAYSGAMFAPPKGFGEGAIYTDEWSVKQIVKDGMVWYYGGTLTKPEELENYAPPDPHNPELYEITRSVVKKVKGDLAIAASAGGIFTEGWLATGLETFIRLLYTNPGSIEKYLDKITSRQIEYGKTLVDIGVDIIWVADDYGLTTGPFLHPSVFRRFITPRLKRVVHTFQKRNIKVFLHSDGHILPLFDDLLDAGIDGYHPVERSAGMKLDFMKEKYGKKVVLIGNVNSKTVLQQGPLSELEKQVLECLRIGAPGGGYIFASDHSIHEGIPPENAKFIFRTARRYGTYPIQTSSKHAF